MFVQDFIVIERPYPDVWRAVASDPSGILGGSTADASEQVVSLRARVGPARTPDRLQRTVELAVGAVRHSGDATLVGFSWESDGVLGGLFPHFDGDLEVAPFGPDATELSVRGRYDPPGGSVGRNLDRMMLHRLAESTVRAFLGGLAARLVAPPTVPEPNHHQ